MKSFQFLLTFSLAFLVIACENEQQAQQPIPLEEALKNQNLTTATTAAPFVEDTSKKSSLPFDNMAAQNSPQTASQPSQSSNVASAPVKPSNVKLNPPHGQIGHRCDIADGAPLPNTAANTQPVQTQPVAQTQILPPVQQVKNTTPSKNTAATTGLNPAHGQPGHRCDISEGAPLNSAPNKVVTPEPVKTSTAVAPGMNPAHGEPGHRCDISVGAPLPKN